MPFLAPVWLRWQWAHYECGGIQNRLDVFQEDGILWVCGACIDNEDSKSKPKAKPWQDFVRTGYLIENIEVLCLPPIVVRCHSCDVSSWVSELGLFGACCATAGSVVVADCSSRAQGAVCDDAGQDPRRRVRVRVQR